MKKNEIAGIITSKSDIQTSLRLLIHHQPPNAFKPISRCLHIKNLQIINTGFLLRSDSSPVLLAKIMSLLVSYCC